MTIWHILYPIIFVSLGFVFVQANRKKLPWLVASPFAVNLVANLISMPIQFRMQNLLLAALDILAVWATIIGMAVRPRFRWEVVAQGPCFIWVSLAIVLRLSFNAMNWRRS